MTARLVAAVIAFVAGAGLIIQFQATHAAVGSASETLWILARYFTILTNFAVAVMMVALALGRRLPPSLIAGVTLAILLVGIVFVTLLRGLRELSGGALLADILLHKATPLLVPAWWLMFAAKGRLEWRDPWLWALYPLAYFPYALWRGSIEGKYAYPFIDVGEQGWAMVLVNAALIAAAFVIGGLLMTALDRRLGGHSITSWERRPINPKVQEEE